MPRKEVPNNNNAQKKSKKGFFSRLFRKKDETKKGQANSSEQAPPSAELENSSAQAPPSAGAGMTEEEDIRYRIQEMKARNANAVMMRMEADAKERQRREEEERKEKAARAAREANTQMLEKEQSDRQEKRYKFQSAVDGAAQLFDVVYNESLSINKDGRSHTAAVRNRLEAQGVNLEGGNLLYNDIQSAYGDLEEDMYYSSSYNLTMKGLDAKRKRAEESYGTAQKHMVKYTEARKSLEKTANKTVEKKILVKIGKLSGQSASASTQTQPQTPTPAPATAQQSTSFYSLKDILSGIASTAKNFFGMANEITAETDALETTSDIMETNLGHAGDLKDVVETAMDIQEYGLNGKAPDEDGFDSGTATGAVMDCVNGLIAVYKAVKSFMSIWQKNKERKQRNEERDGHTVWQHVRELISQVISLGTSALGIASSYVPSPVSEILGIIGNGLNLLGQFITIGDSAVRIIGSKARKNMLWKKIQRKREKYKSDKNADAELEEAYNIGFFWRTSKIKAKRDQLRAKLASGLYSLQGGGQNNTGQAIATRQELTEKHRKVKVGYGSDYTTLSDKIMAEKTWAAGQTNFKGSWAYRDYKKRVRLMEALEIMEQYYTLDQAENRQLKLAGHTLEDAVKEGSSMIANLTDIVQLFSTGTVGVGKILKIGIAVGSMVRNGVSSAYSTWSEKSGHNNDKEFIRKEMAETLYNSIEGLTKDSEYNLSEGMFAFDQMKDRYLASAESRVSELSSVVTTLDLSMAGLMTAGNKADMIASMAAAFSQEGNG